MTRIWVRPVAVICGLFVLSSAGADEAAVAAGGELYAEFCSNCHGDNKSGLQEYKDDLATFTDRLEGMTEEMPDFAGFFEEEEIAQMHAYLSAPQE